MVNLIMNEKLFIEEILKNKKKPRFVSNRYLIKLLYRYYYKEGMTEEEAILNIFEKSKDIEIEGYIEYVFYNQIVFNVKEEIEYDKKIKLREFEYIPLYESELNIINTCKTDREKKFLFTCFILSRFYNNQWIGIKDSDLFKIANISMTERDRQFFIHTMKEKNYISLPKNNTNTSIKLNKEEILSGDKEVIKVIVLENLGNQFLSKYKEGYKQCSQCGKLIKIKGNRQIYCDKCAEEIESENAIERKRKQRERENVTI